MKVALRIPETEAEGPGRRYALWVQGCPIQCPGCCNPEMFDNLAGTSVPVGELVAEVLTARSVHGIEGVSFLGGEPFAQAESLARLAEDLRVEGVSVMVFTGWTLAELRGRADPAVDRLLAATDLLVDGRFEAAQRSTTRRWVGSDNQMLHFLTARYSPNDPRFHEGNHVEIRLRDGVITLNGWPVHGARTGRM